MYAAYHGNAAMVKVLLEVGAAPDLIEERYGHTALCYAAERGQCDAALELVEGGADVEVKNNSGLTALLVACVHSRTETAEMLLLHGADINTRSNLENTPLMNAVQKTGRSRASCVF